MIRLIPLAAIITPATLSVQTAPVLPVPSKPRFVPNLDFRSLSFSATLTGEQTSHGTLYNYDGPSLAVKRVVGATALQGAILPMQAPRPNSTWNIAFMGPSVCCKQVESKLRNTILQNIAESTLTIKKCFSPPVYLSWFGADGSLPFDNDTSQNNQDASFYVALMPSLLRPDMLAPWNPEYCSFLEWFPNTGNWSSPVNPFGPDDSTIVRCDLVESHYNVTFDFVEGNQTVTADILARDTPLQTISRVTIQEDNTLRTLSYQSIFYAFSEWMLGSIENGLNQQRSLIVGSNITSTVLLRAREMDYLMPQNADSILRSIYHTDLQSDMAENGNKYFSGLAPTRIPTSNQSIVTMMQDLFMNTTVSLMSSPELQSVSIISISLERMCQLLTHPTTDQIRPHLQRHQKRP